MKSNAIDEDDNDRLLSERRVSEKLGIGLRALRGWRHAGQGEGPPVTRIGRRVFYRQGAARQWLRDQEAGGSGGVRPPYKAFCGALRQRFREVSAAEGLSLNFGADVLRDALTLRMAPALERLFFRPHPNSDCDRGSLVVVPFPAAVLGLGAGVNLSPYMEAVQRLATRHAGVIIAEPGHDWVRHIEEPHSLAPFADGPFGCVVLYRVDRLLSISDAGTSGAILGPGDALERELKAVTRALGLPFHVEGVDKGWQLAGDVAAGIVDKIDAQRSACSGESSGRD